MQKKEQSFVGSKEWIGSIEISDYLNESLGVTCYIMHSIRGAEIASRSRELMEHFDKQGTPVMIGKQNTGCSLPAVNIPYWTPQVVTPWRTLYWECISQRKLVMFGS